MKQARRPHEAVWRDCYDLVHPIRASGFYGFDVTADQAQAAKARILDSTATDSARILTSALMSGMTPANSRWFALEIGTESDEERRWLDDSAQVLFQNIHASNFDASAFEACTDVVDAGWFVLYITEDEDGGFRFEQWPLSQCYVSSSKAGGIVDTVFREYVLTVEQVVNEFGRQPGAKAIDWSRISDRVATLHRADKLDEKVKLCHAIQPRTVSMVGAKLGKNMPFSSVHFELDGAKAMLREGGYDEFPCACPRWMLIPGSCYGTGPVADALPDIRTVNQIKAMALAAMDVALSGMWKAKDDGEFNPATMTIGPRRVVIVNDMENVQPLTTGVDFKVAFMTEEQLQRQIRKILLADQLQPQEGPAMTATEVQTRVQMIRQLLGPIYGRLQSEYLQPLIDRCFGIAFRASEKLWQLAHQGVLSKPPTTLDGRTLHVKYISPLARAQKMEEVNAIDIWVNTIVQRAAALQDPSQLDIVDLEESDRLRGEGLGVPNKAMRKVEDITKMRADRAAQAKQQQAEAAQQQAAVAAAPQMAKQA